MHARGMPATCTTGDIRCVGKHGGITGVQPKTNGMLGIKDPRSSIRRNNSHRVPTFFLSELSSGCPSNLTHIDYETTQWLNSCLSFRLESNNHARRIKESQVVLIPVDHNAPTIRPVLGYAMLAATPDPTPADAHHHRDIPASCHHLLYLAVILLRLRPRECHVIIARHFATRPHQRSPHRFGVVIKLNTWIRFQCCPSVIQKQALPRKIRRSVQSNRAQHFRTCTLARMPLNLQYQSTIEFRPVIKKEMRPC